mmetsp:Transcript_16812/g.41614  ORF Transcript_16812/g.41614 Transcript_16812/m.41614 type:complete len:224 (+) Transcript_16812:1008-1679(+)
MPVGIFSRQNRYSQVKPLAICATNGRGGVFSWCSRRTSGVLNPVRSSPSKPLDSRFAFAKRAGMFAVESASGPSAAVPPTAAGETDEADDAAEKLSESHGSAGYTCTSAPSSWSPDSDTRTPPPRGESSLKTASTDGRERISVSTVVPVTSLFPNSSSSASTSPRAPPPAFIDKAHAVSGAGGFGGGGSCSRTTSKAATPAPSFSSTSPSSCTWRCSLESPGG